MQDVKDMFRGRILRTYEGAGFQRHIEGQDFKDILRLRMLRMLRTIWCRQDVMDYMVHVGFQGP